MCLCAFETVPPPFPALLPEWSGRERGQERKIERRIDEGGTGGDKRGNVWISLSFVTSAPTDDGKS